MSTPLQKKHVPLRKCTGCGEMKPKRELIRVVKSPPQKDQEGNDIPGTSEISLDITGKKSGRGVYICLSVGCLKTARKARRFEKSFSCKIPDEVYTALEEGMPNE